MCTESEGKSLKTASVILLVVAFPWSIDSRGHCSHEIINTVFTHNLLEHSKPRVPSPIMAGTAVQYTYAKSDQELSILHRILNKKQLIGKALSEIWGTRSLV